jgi:hypothetical protein
LSLFFLFSLNKECDSGASETARMTYTTTKANSWKKCLDEKNRKF